MSKGLMQISYDVDKIDQIEGKLQKILHPVRPDPGFVYRLHHRLVTPPGIVLEQDTGRAVLILVAFGLFFGVLITWILRRWHG